METKKNYFVSSISKLSPAYLLMEFGIIRGFINVIEKVAPPGLSSHTLQDNGVRTWVSGSKGRYP
tara:strand:+ start:62592 stop:62786 length:195 start_codon:yes stop_codon:yes gene_type:complete